MATNALATRENTSVQRADNEYGRLRNQLETRADDFKMALPAHITAEKFQRTVLTAAQSNPDLLKADRASFITSCMKAAQDGLLPDGREAAIVTFKTRKKDGNQWIDVFLAQYMPMAHGVRKKILQSGDVSSLETNVVYRAEVEAGAFIYEAGTEAMLRHRPMLELTDDDMSDDNIVAAYSVAVMKDGAKSFEVMRRGEINKVRQTSQTGALGKTTRDGKPIPPKGPWVDWFGEMARKTVMRRHSKTLPMSGDLIDVEAQDDAMLARSATGLLAAVEPDAPTALPPTREEAALAEGADPETGEISDDAGRSADPSEDTTDADDQNLDAQGREVDAQEAAAKDIIARAERIELVADYTKLAEEAQPHIDAMQDEDMAGACNKALRDARKRVTGK